jgi:hypothetical protein
LPGKSLRLLLLALTPRLEDQRCLRISGEQVIYRSIATSKFSVPQEKGKAGTTDKSGKILKVSLDLQGALGKQSYAVISS